MKRFVFTLVLISLVFPALRAGNISFVVAQNNDWVWYAPDYPQIDVIAKNNGNKVDTCNIRLKIASDKGVYVNDFSQKTIIASNDSSVLNFKFRVDPGFYRCSVLSNDSVVKTFNIGFEPENIVSLPDNQPDFKEFWNKAIEDLAKVAPQYSMTEETQKSNKVRKVYLVKMKSLENEEIQGYLTIPTKKGKFPAKLYFMGYGSKPWFADPDSNVDMIEFVLSTRGQGLNEPNNKYGDWIVYNLQDKDKYYYRGAFMDLIRAIDFVTQLPQWDNKNLFAEGGSQGGAFTLVAAALDNRITAAAPYVPFLSDYTDYFQLTSWPGNSVKKRQQELGMTDAQLFKNLPYFDVKNFARLIKCPVYMGVGLQDHVCPPHTNFSSYNLIRAPKQYIIYPNCGHEVKRPDWNIRGVQFFVKNKK